MGFGKDEMTGHGLRAMARTILDEVPQVRPEFIEHQLAHRLDTAQGIFFVKKYAYRRCG